MPAAITNAIVNDQKKARFIVAPLLSFSLLSRTCAARVSCHAVLQTQFLFCIPNRRRQAACVLCTGRNRTAIDDASPQYADSHHAGKKTAHGQHQHLQHAGKDLIRRQAHSSLQYQPRNGCPKKNASSPMLPRKTPNGNWWCRSATCADAHPFRIAAVRES